MCIHHYEGKWTANTGNGYYGGLQMDMKFQVTYGSAFLVRWGTADNWPIWAQVRGRSARVRQGTWLHALAEHRAGLRAALSPRLTRAHSSHERSSAPRPLVDELGMARPTRVGAAAASANVVPIGAGGSAETLVESYKRLAEVFHHVLSEQSVDALLDRIAGTLADLMPYDALHVYEADEEHGELVPVLARSQWYEEEIMGSRPKFGEGLTGWAVEHRTPVWTNRAHLDPRVVNVPGTPVEPEALITIPLVARGSLKGALNIYRVGESAVFFEHEFELAKWFGDAAALAMDNAHIRMRLEHLAQTDSLTGLYNHRYFHERLRAELTRASRFRDSIAVLMLDLDDFKRVNDIHGHSAGDQLLVHVARVAKETVRASDIACRIGGEEFAVIMPSCDAAAALGLAARLTERISEIDVDPVHSVTISIGVAQGPQHAASARELIGCAEAAMMTAKARGKNQVVLYDEDATERPDAEAAGRDLRSMGHMKLLQSLAGKLNRLNDVQEIGATIATELRLLIDYHNCRVVLRDGEELKPIAFVGDFDTRLGSAADVYTTVVGVGITGRVVETGESLLVPNALQCEYAVSVPNSEEIDESLAAVPLRYGSRVTGAIVISKLGLDQFDEDDIRLLEVLAGQASVALENARLYDQQRREAANAKALLAFLDEVSQAQSFDEICTRTVETAATLFETPVVSLWLQDGAGEFYRAASCGSAELVDRRLGRRQRRPSRARMAGAVPRRDRPGGAAPRGRRRDRLDRGGEGQPGGGPRGGAAPAGRVLVSGVGRAAQSAALLAAARGRGDRERPARCQP